MSGNDLMSERVETVLPGVDGVTYWRVEGSLLNLSAVRPVAFFTWNAQRFSERWLRRGGLALLALVRPLLYSLSRRVATRAL
ncbi:MAG: hypothetical protein EBZ36_18325, partial [Acidobacteria bacterium]|nr:hypothetical protein [Acidobacteriota bacterium]